MSESAGALESNQELRGSKSHIFRNRKLTFILVIALLASIGAGTYAFIYNSAKNAFSNGCVNNMSGISESFRNYQKSSHKPNIFGDNRSTPSSYNTALSTGIGNLRKITEEYGVYPGAKKALEELNIYTAELSKFQNLKGKILGIELNNPAKSDLEAWSYIAKVNAFRLATDPAFKKRIETLGYRFERKWDSYMASKVSKSEYLELDRLAKVLDGRYSRISELCRIAR